MTSDAAAVPAGVAVRSLDASYGRTRILHGVDLTVSRGDVACVLGPSGSGKTTLLRVLAGFLPAEAGSVAIGGRVVDDGRRRVPSEQRRVGYVPQEGALFPHLTVAANIGFGLARHTSKRRTLRRGRVAELLELVGLTSVGDRHPHELSGGQQQRVALARALAIEPELVLLDEPFAALDTSLRRRLRFDVRAALRATGVTAVLVTHDQTEALSLGDQVVLMRDGRVRQAGSPAELYRRPADDWIARFVGDATLVAADICDGTAHTPLGPLSLAPGAIPNRGRSQVVIRPEQVKLVAEASVSGTGARDPRVHRGEVTRTEYYGHDALVEIRVPNAQCPLTLVARILGPAQPPEPGNTVAFIVEGPVQVIVDTDNEPQ